MVKARKRLRLRPWLVNKEDHTLFPLSFNAITTMNTVNSIIIGTVDTVDKIIKKSAMRRRANDEN